MADVFDQIAEQHGVSDGTNSDPFADISSRFGVPASAPASTSLGQFATDRLRDLAAGTNSFVRGGLELGRLALNPAAPEIPGVPDYLQPRGPVSAIAHATGADSAVSDALDAASSQLNDNSQSWQQGQSQGLQELRQQRQQLDHTGDKVFQTLTHPSLLASDVAQSVPEMAAIIMSGGAAAETRLGQLLAEGVAKQEAEKGALKAAVHANVAASGASGGAHAAAQSRDTVNAMSDAELAASPEYQQLVQQTGSPEEAKRIIADSASQIAFGWAAPTSALASLVGAGTEARLAMGKGTGGFLPTVAKEAGEEYLQEGPSEQMGQNMGQKYSGAMPNQSLTEGVNDAGAMGAVAGAAMGGGMHAAGHLTAHKGEAQRPITEEQSSTLANAVREGMQQGQPQAPAAPEPAPPTPQDSYVAERTAALQERNKAIQGIEEARRQSIQQARSTLTDAAELAKAETEIEAKAQSDRQAAETAFVTRDEVAKARLQQSQLQPGPAPKPVTPEPAMPAPAPAPAAPDARTGAERRAEIRPGTDRRLPQPHEVLRQEFENKARKVNLTDQQIEELAPQPEIDSVTGWNNLQGKNFLQQRMVEEAQRHIEETGAPAHYVSLDLQNLGGLNAFHNDVADNANADYKAIMDVVREELDGTGGQVYMRTGGDELSAIVSGGHAADIRSALDRAAARIQEYADSRGFGSIDHAKGKPTKGVNVYGGSVEIKPGRNPQDVINAADKQMGLQKQAAIERALAEQNGEANVGRITPQEAGPVAPDREAGFRDQGRAGEVVPRGSAETGTAGPRVRNSAQKSAIDPATDSLATAAAKLGGLSTTEAAERGIDLKDNRQQGGIKYLINRNGRTFDQMAESLSELGYPVTDRTGRPDPHVLEERLRDSLSGIDHYTPQGDAARMEREHQQQSAAEDHIPGFDGTHSLPDVGEHPPFRRGADTTKGGLSRDVAQQIVAEHAGAWKGAPKIDVVDALPNRIKGMYESGRVTIAAGNHKSRADLIQTLEHEVLAHYAQQLRGTDAMRKTLSAVLRLERNGDARAKAWGEHVDRLQPGLDRPVRAEEMLARAVETGEYKLIPALKRLVADLVAIIRAALTKSGNPAAKWEEAKLTQSVFAGLREGHRMVEQGKTGTEAGQRRYQFAGPGSQNADLMSLDSARERLAKGEPAEYVRRETGWFRGVDGKWRYEIPDDEARFIEPPISMSWKDYFDSRKQEKFGKKEVYQSDLSGAELREYEALLRQAEDEYNRRNGRRRLADVLDHPKLFAAYPDLAGVVVGFRQSDDFRGAYYPQADLIELNVDRTPEEMLSTLLHEVQHAIQHREGFATGGNLDAQFVDSVKAALGELHNRSQQEAEQWKWQNKYKVDSYKEAAQVARYGLMYESAQRLIDYANRESPSGVLRLIRNEMQWIYTPGLRDTEVANELGREFYNIPKRHKMRERNQFLSDLSFKAGRMLLDHIPQHFREQFKSDPRTMKGMIRALEREVERKSRDLQPLYDLQSTARSAKNVVDAHRYSGPFDIYRALAGEVEARNTQARQKLTAEERHNASPGSTQDVPSDNVIVMFGGMDIQAPTAMAHTVYHGSPHDFDKFTTAKIGTGEGAQAYGWGMYFAGKKQVAEHYRKGLSEKDLVNKARDAYDEGYDPDEAAGLLLSDPALSESQRELVQALKADDWLGFDYPHQAIRAALREPENFDMSPAVHEALAKQGRLYQVELAPQESDYLLWDKPLSEQPEKVRQALEGAFTDERLDDYTRTVLKKGGEGAAIYNTLAADDRLGGTPKAASDYLDSIGIPGIKYLDGTSRRQNLDQIEAKVRLAEKRLAMAKEQGSAEQQSAWEQKLQEAKAELADVSYNYVIFHDNHVKAATKYRIGEEEFVGAPDGQEDFGAISDEVAKSIGRQAGKIRLPVGEQRADGTGYGLAHIEAKHGEQIRKAGFKDVPDFIAYVAKNFNEIWSAGAGQLLEVVRGDGRHDVMFVQLQPAKDGDYYRVNSAYPVRQDSYEAKRKMRPLWQRSEPTAQASGEPAAFAGGPEQRPNQTAPYAQRQSGKESVAQDNPAGNTEGQKYRKGGPANDGKNIPGRLQNLGFGTDEAGDRVFKPGGAAYERLAAGARQLLGEKASQVLGAKWALADTTPKAFRQLMREYVRDFNKAQSDAVNIGKAGQPLSANERSLLSDVLEKELEAGIEPPKTIEAIAVAMRDALNMQTDALVEMGMLSPESAERWRDTYLPRLYKRAANDDVAKQSYALAARMKVKGEHLKGRGIFKEVQASDQADYEKLGWEKRADGENGPIMWRDFNKQEREKMGENRDALERFMRGFLHTQRDIATGRLLARVASNPDLASETKIEGWTKVPNDSISDTGGVKKYGKLAGMYVHPEVWEHLRYQIEDRTELERMYRKALSVWKEGKTALNPVGHTNNVMSNVVLVTAAGANGLDISRGLTSYFKKDAFYREAVEVGLLGNEWYGGEIKAILGEDAGKEMRPMSLGRRWLAGMASKVWNNSAFKTLRTFYDAEDAMFKVVLFRMAREKGLSVEQAVDYAETFIFNYRDLPSGIKNLRDYAIPFVGYTYKAVPAMARLALTRPHRVAAIVGALYGLNALSFLMLGSAGNEDDERKVMPEWQRGFSLWGVPKLIRLPLNHNGRATYLDIYRWMPLGDFLDTGNDSAGADLPSWAMMGGPLWDAYNVLWNNRDSFTGRDFFEKSDTTGQKIKKVIHWQGANWLPMYYHTKKNLDALRNQVDGDSALGKALDSMGISGMGRSGESVDQAEAALGAFGVKVRSFDPEEERIKRLKGISYDQRDIRDAMRREQRDRSLPPSRRKELLQERMQQIEEIGKEADLYK